MGSSDATERVRRLYDDAANRYDTWMPLAEKLFLAGGREWVASGARGRTLEVAIGTGRNLPYYPRDVELAGVDVSSAMLDIARRRARELGREVDLRVGDAHLLEFADRSFDTVVFTLALCTIPADRRAVAEAWRVLRPGGCLRMLEHVRSPVLAVRMGQRVLEPLFLRLASDHLLREPLEHVEVERFEIECLRRSSWGIVERLAARKLVIDQLQ